MGRDGDTGDAAGGTGNRYTYSAQTETPETETEPGETVPEEQGEETVQTEPEGIPAYVKADFTDLYADEPETLVWEDEDVVITISETVAGAFRRTRGCRSSRSGKRSRKRL